MVKITKYNPKKHFHVVSDLLKAQGSPLFDSVSPETLPKIGFIIYSNKEYRYVGAVFIRRVEGGFGQVDTLVTNPECSSEIRHLALIMIRDKVIETAKSLGLKAIYAFTESKSVLLRSEAAGFHVIGQSIITLPL